MGRLTQRPLLLFGLLLLGPAVGFVLLGWRSVRTDEALRRGVAEREAESILAAEVDRAASGLEALRRTEEERPYFQYQTEYVPPEVVAEAGVALQDSPIVAGPARDARILGWFQWEAGPHGVPDAPETFGARAASWGDGFARAYGPALRERLAHATADPAAVADRKVDYPLWVVKGNEERGQLFEELQLANTQLRQSANANAGANTAPAPEGARADAPRQAAPVQITQQSSYLQSFFQLGDDAVPVRYSRFRHLARAHGADGPALVAWRLVHVPALHAQKRERARDRWILQGYALDPAVRPGTWVPVGPVFVCRGDCPAPSGAVATHASLVPRLGADVLGETGAVPDASLVWGAYPDPATWVAEGAAARQRFWLLVGALLLVTATGFVFLLRSVRRELRLARRKEDFVAAVTHELKTPLTGIRMYAEMLREGWAQDEEAARRQAQRILDESARLGALVDQVLDLAALERGVLAANLAPGDLAGCVRSAAESLEPKAKEAGVALVVDVPRDLPPAPFDDRLVRPLVLNLVDNALKHAASGKEVRVALAVEGGRPVLRVADRGPGIPPEILARPSEPFQRGGGEMTRTTTGIGIGLALVHRYAAALGATVAIEAAPGRGTTVVVAFRPA